MMATANDRSEPGLFLQIEIDPDVVRVVYAATLPHVSRAELRRPLLTSESAADLRGSSELVLATLDKGGVREAFAWSSRSIAFTDREDEEGTGALRGMPRDSELNTRVLRIPVSEDAQFLLFYTCELSDGKRSIDGQMSLIERPMGLYFLGDPEGLVPPVPPLPFPWPKPPIPWPLPFRRHRQVKRPRPPRKPNRLAGTRTLVDNGPAEDRFDIVILGDGFDVNDLAEFDKRALAIANGLLAMPPFDALASKINIHTVRALSLQSGIGDCPVPGTKKSTYFDVRGNFNGQYPGFVGTTTPERIYLAAELIAPREYLEVFLVVANCAIEGGSAFPPQRLAFVTMYADLTKFVNIAAHELAHVIAGTAEEYIGCAEADPLTVYPNQATDAQRVADTISWKPLALPIELDPALHFRAQHVGGDPFDANNQPIVLRELEGMLGAYWGCQDIDPAIPAGPSACHPYQDPRGVGFFRPMAACRMRKSFFDFCRVCSARLTQAVLAAVR